MDGVAEKKNKVPGRVRYRVVSITEGMSNTTTGSDSRFEAQSGLQSDSAPRLMQPGPGKLTHAAKSCSSPRRSGAMLVSMPW
jgi:hypothetical protein